MNAYTVVLIISAVILLVVHGARTFLRWRKQAFERVTKLIISFRTSYGNPTAFEILMRCFAYVISMVFLQIASVTMILMV